MIPYLQSLADSAGVAIGTTGPWDVVTKITTPLMLLALVVVAWYLWSVAKLREESNRLEKVPEERRYELADTLARKYGVPVADLPPQERVGIVHKELSARRDHQRHVTWLAFAAFALATLLWFASMVFAEPIKTAMARNGDQQTQRVIPLVRETPDVPFPGAICLGNPALPPADGCVALLGGDVERQGLMFETPTWAEGQQVSDASIHLHGLTDNSTNPKPQCISVSLDGKALRRVDLKLDPITISDRLSDETAVGTVVVPLTRGARNLISAEGRHRVTLEIPTGCAARGFVAFRRVELVIIQG